MSTLPMDLRSVDFDERLIVGLVAPYDETSYLTGDPGGERLRKGCFNKSIAQRGARIPLLLGHDHKGRAVGMSTGWEDTPEGLLATFKVRDGTDADEALADARDGYRSALSVGFEALRVGGRVRAPDGAVLVTDAKLHEVSLVGVGAYSDARVLAVRAAELPVDVDKLLAPFKNPPAVDMSPLPPLWG